RTAARCDRKGDKLRDLWLGFASLRSLYDLGMKKDDVMGYEFMGEVMEVGPGVNGRLKVGERVVVPFTIICGECEQCRRGNFSICERTNRNKDKADKVFGHTTAGLFGYTHLTGGYAGGQAEYV